MRCAAGAPPHEFGIRPCLQQKFNLMFTSLQEEITPEMEAAHAHQLDDARAMCAALPSGSHACEGHFLCNAPRHARPAVHDISRQHTKLHDCRRNERVRSKQAQIAADEWARIDALKAAQAAQQGADIADAWFQLYTCVS